MYITVYSLGGSPGGIHGNRIARQQPFLPSFFLRRAAAATINQSKAEKERSSTWKVQNTSRKQWMLVPHVKIHTMYWWMHQQHKNIHQPFQFNEVVCTAVNIQLLLKMFFYHLSYNQIFFFFIFMSLLFQCSKFNVNVSCILNQTERTWLKFN